MSHDRRYNSDSDSPTPPPYEWYKTLRPLHNGHSVAAPACYEVTIFHDRFTPASFLLTLLQDLFHLEFGEAKQQVMMWTNKQTISCMVSTRDVAETKMIEVIQSARAHHHPLRCVIRKQRD